MNVSKWLSVAVAAVAAGTVSGEDLPLVYANDFTTRWSKWPIGGVTEYRYDTVGTDLIYAKNTAWQIYDSTTLAVRNDTDGLQPLGTDGWRRQGRYGQGTTLLLQNNDYLTFKCDGAKISWNFATAVTPLGSRLVNGIVRVRADFRTPLQWHASEGLVRVGVGNDTVWTGNNSTWSSGMLGWFGVKQANTTWNCATSNPYIGGDDTVTSTETLDNTHFYRVEVEIDMDKSPKTVKYWLYDLGTTYSLSAEGTCVCSSFETMLKTTPSPQEISTLAVAASGLPLNNESFAYFCRLSVHAKPTGATEEKLIYYNTFHAGQRIVDSVNETQALLTPLDVGATGQDGFVRNYGGGRAIVTRASDSVCEFDLSDVAGSTYASIIQPLGESFRSSPIVAQVDMRPPSKWIDTYNSYMMMSLCGNSKNTNPFGVCNATMGTATGTASKFFIFKTANGYRTTVMGTASADPTHWYRFVATTDYKNETTTVKVYDMGTSKWAVDAELPANKLVETLSAPFRYSKNEIGGISHLELMVYGTTSSPFNDKYSPLFDNIRVWADKPGMVITVR